MSHQQITVNIHCRDLPGTQFGERSAVRLGIQQGKDVVEDVPANVPEVTFTVPLQVSRNPKNPYPKFGGPFAQGRPGEQFIYLCWGERLNREWDGFRRAKILLKHLDWKSLDKILAAGQPVEVTIYMTDPKGGPACGSFKEADIEWKL